MKKIKNKKKLLLIFILLLAIGGTIAYFSNLQIFDNLFLTKALPTLRTEELFISPDGWEPGDTTPKTIRTTNVDSDENICIRMKFDESWVSKNGNNLPLFQNGNRAAIINMINTDKWKKASDNWYYYQNELSRGQTSLSPIESVTFNPLIEGDTACTTETVGNEITKTCSSTGNGYDDATYTLTLTTEGIECEYVDDYWNPVYPNLLYNAVENSASKYKYPVTTNLGGIDSIQPIANPKTIYFETSPNASNVKFANHCWKIVRTTETGGVKLMYYGEYDEEKKCGTDRDTHVGYSTPNAANAILSGNYLYGSDFIYNSDSQMFTPSGITNYITYDGTNIDDIKGKYTCRNYTSCSTLYLVVDKSINGSSNEVLAHRLVSNAHFSQYGETPFNVFKTSPSALGYMYNKIYYLNQLAVDGTETFKFGSSFVYNNNTGVYTLSGTISDVSDVLNADLSNTHYTCFTSSNTCTDLKYVYYRYNTSSIKELDYFVLVEGKDIVQMMDEMLHNNNVNRYDSLIKSGIDKWYEHYLLSYSDKLEDLVFCNDRSYTSSSIDNGRYEVSGFNPNGGGVDNALGFNQSSHVSTSLICSNVTDKFSTKNELAKLTYPVALLTERERLLLNKSRSASLSPSPVSTGQWQWYGTPCSINGTSIDGCGTGSAGVLSYIGIGSKSGIRPVISLKPGTTYSVGDGSLLNPYEVI